MSNRDTIMGIFQRAITEGKDFGLNFISVAGVVQEGRVGLTFHCTETIPQPLHKITLPGWVGGLTKVGRRSHKRTIKRTAKRHVRRKAARRARRKATK